VCVPAPAVKGLKSPLDVFIIPVPDHTPAAPPEVAATSVWKPAFEQRGPISVIVALGALFTVRLKVIGVPMQFP
jgi:hypothetical protein